MATIIRPSRRGFITGLASLVAAPAIVRVSSLMPVKALIDPYANISMRMLTNYVPGPTSSMDVLYGMMQAQQEMIRFCGLVLIDAIPARYDIKNNDA